MNIIFVRVYKTHWLLVIAEYCSFFFGGILIHYFTSNINISLSWDQKFVFVPSKSMLSFSNFGVILWSVVFFWKGLSKYANFTWILNLYLTHFPLKFTGISFWQQRKMINKKCGKNALNFDDSVFLIEMISYCYIIYEWTWIIEIIGK